MGSDERRDLIAWMDADKEPVAHKRRIEQACAKLAAIKTLDTSGSPAGSGALFGLAVAPKGQGVYFVDDATNKLRLLH